MMDDELFGVMARHPLAVWDYLGVAGSIAVERPAWEYPEAAITWGALSDGAGDEWAVLGVLFERPVLLAIPGSETVTTTLIQATETLDAWIGPTTSPPPRRGAPDAPGRILTYWRKAHASGYVEFDESQRVHYVLSRPGL